MNPGVSIFINGLKMSESTVDDSSVFYACNNESNVKCVMWFSESKAEEAIRMLMKAYPRLSRIGWLKVGKDI